MLTKEQVRRMSGYSYARGTELHQSGKLISWRAEEEVQYLRIDAVVKGSGRKRYEVSIALEKETDMVAESYCECPAFYSYQGLCKHCVAVLLQYISQRDQEKTISDFPLRREKKQERAVPGDERQFTAGSGRRLMEGTPFGKKTTAQMKELLQKQAVRQTLPVLCGETWGKVRLEPLLCCDSHSCTVEFRIGVTKMYVLKDVFAFARSMKEQEDYSYGKSLQFVHTLGSFDVQSKPVAGFLLNWVHKNKRAYMQTAYYSLSMPKLRHVPLDEWEMGAFLDAVGDCSFLANVNDGGEKIWRVTKEPLHRRMYLNRAAGGMEVSLEPAFGFLYGEDYICFSNQKIYRCGRDWLAPVSAFMECMEELPGYTAFIQKEDIPAFFRQQMPALKERFDCIFSGIREEDFKSASAVFQFYLDMPQRDLVTCSVLAVYGEDKYSVFDHSPDMERRDLCKEAEVSGIVSCYCNAFEEQGKQMAIREDDSLMYELLSEGIPRFQELGEVYVSDALKRIRVIQTPKVSVGVSLSGDLLELTVASEDISKEQLAEILSRYDRRKKYTRLKDGSFLHAEGEELSSLQEIRQALQLTERQLRQDVVRVPRYRMMYLDEVLSANDRMTVRKDQSFRERVRDMKMFGEQEFEIPESLQGTLRDYQKYGFYWMKTLCCNGFGGILADDMGLGKTLQVICFLQSEFEKHEEKRRCLIVCPASLVYNWKREFEKFAPDLPVRMVVGSAAERCQILKAEREDGILITSYDLLRRDMEYYEPLSFFCQIIDEAQYIKNQGTQAARAVKNVSAGFKLALTGTPVENRLSELWSIFDYLMPGYLYGYQRFKEELEYPIVHREDEAAGIRLQKLIRPFLLRRLKQDVLKELPEKIEENVYADMDGEQQKLYDAHVKRMRMMLDQTDDTAFRSSKIQILAELTRLRQLCCDPALLYENYKGNSAKTDVVRNLIRNAVENGHKVLLFSQFTSMLERLARMLAEEHISYYMLTGATAKERRAEMVEGFAYDSVMVFCISLKAGGTGLNLTSADVVIHFDPWWNVAVQNQATDRAHRIGQRNAVNVYRLIAKDSIEEKIMELQLRKRELADRILGGEGIDSGSLTREELMELLR